MKVMMLADAASAHTIRWVGALARRGHQLELLSLRPPPPGAYEPLSAQVTVHWLGVEPGVAGSAEGHLRNAIYLRSLPRVRAVLRASRPDLVHVHYASSYGLLATLLNARPRVVSVWGQDVYSYPERSPLHRWLTRWVLASADVVLSTSETMRRQVLRLVNREVLVTPFGVDVDEFSPRERGAHRDTCVVGTVKSLEPKYGIEYLVRAFALLTRNAAERNDWRLVIVGGGSLRGALEALAAELGIASQVRFTGPCSVHEVAAWHRSFDVAVYPSVDESESFGVAAVESQSCGVPTIVTRVGGLPEVVADGITGVVVPPRDPAALATALRDLLLDPLRREAMGDAARRRVLEKFSLEACTDLLEAIYGRVSQRRDCAYAR
jgi:glycosyltransferase involved in cell wall biosynthesis